MLVHLDPLERQAVLEILVSRDPLEKLELQEQWVKEVHMVLRACKDSLDLQGSLVCLA